VTRSKSARSGGLVGSLLVIVGALAVLGVAFGVGVATGRRWLRLDTLGRWTRSDALVDPAGTRSARPGRSPQSSAPASRSESPPSLTFYRELTAPLAPPSRSARADSAKLPKTAKPASGEARPKPDRPLGGAGEGRTGETPGGVADPEPTFTVQVAAYRTRSQAEAFRETLAARGLDADVTAATTPDGTRYRVRVGNYRTKAAAQDAALRLAADTRLGVFVATR
jgi:cell division protein FtsN